MSPSENQILAYHIACCVYFIPKEIFNDITRITVSEFPTLTLLRTVIQPDEDVSEQNAVIILISVY